MTVHPLPTTTFVKLNTINTQAATSSEISHSNIRKNIKRPLRRVHEMDGFKVRKGDMPIALVGGGPSLKDNLQYLRNFQGVIVACGSAHDYLVDNHVPVTYTVVCDPDPITANYIKKPQFNTTYLVATQCADEVFETLKNNAVYMWHCYSEDYDFYKDLEPNFEAIGGGCTVGLRSLSIAVMFGYRNIHFFGFDSCLGTNDKHHAYDFSTNTEEMGKIYEIKVDPESETTYYTAGYLMAQCQHFQQFYAAYMELFEPTFHGTGLLPAFMDEMTKAVNLAKAKEVKELEHGS